MVNYNSSNGLPHRLVKSNTGSVPGPTRPSNNGGGGNKEHWFLSGIFNCFWVITYFISGTTHMAFKYSWYLATFLMLRFPRWVFFEASRVQLSIPFSVLLFLVIVGLIVTYDILKDKWFSQYKNLTSDLDDTDDLVPGRRSSVGNAGSRLMRNGKLGGKNKNRNSGLNKNKKHSNSNSAGSGGGSGGSGKDNDGLKRHGRRRYSNTHDRLYNHHRHATNNDDDDTFLSSYLDQFLSAIRIFGYLEKPVFHDLTKNMKTQKLDEGEILLLDNSVGFAIVVEGTLNIYHEVDEKNGDSSDPFSIDDSHSVYSILKQNNSRENRLHQQRKKSKQDEDDGILRMRTPGAFEDIFSSDTDGVSPSIMDTSDESDNNDESDDDEDDETTGFIRLKDGLGKFQLLNTVKPGNPVSSLVNILNLFTSANDVVMNSHRNESRVNSNDRSEAMTNNSKLSNSIEESAVRLELGKYALSPIQSNRSNSNNNPRSPTLSRIGTKDEDPLLKSFSDDVMSPMPLQSGDSPLPYAIPKVVARAATDCTIAIIPPQAFVKLTAKYPRSASHIIQMILTKLYHVTFQTAHNYLGLTHEIAYTELLLNRSVDYQIPDYLKEVVVRKLKQKQNNESSSSNSFKEMTSSARKASKFYGPTSYPKSPSDNSSKYSNTIEKLKSSDLGKQNPQIHAPTPITGSRHVVLESRDQYNPGDLLSNVPLSRINLSTAARGFDSNNITKSSSPQTSQSSSKNTIVSSDPKLLRRPSLFTNQTSSRANILKANKSNDVKLRSFSAQEETEDSVVRMAIVEAMLTYVGVSKLNMSVLPSYSNGTRTASSSHRASEISLVSTFASSAAPQTMIRILPSDYAIISNKKHKSSKKKKVYREEVSPNLDYEYARNEFAEAIEFQFFKQGTTIVEQDERGKGLYYVVAGKIDVSTANDRNEELFSTKKSKKKKTQTLFTIESGGIAGYLSSLVGKSFVNLVARTDVYVGYLPYKTLEKLCEKYFLIYLRIAETLTNLLTPRMLKLDHALEWIHLNASDTLFNQGDPANGIYVVLNGRLRQLRNPEIDEAKRNGDCNKKIEVNPENTVVLGELGQGESFGEVEVLTAMDRMSSILAVRDTELARIPRALFELLAIEHPSIMVRVSRLVAKKIINGNQGNMSISKIGSENGIRHDLNLTIPTSPNSSTHAHSYGHDQSNQINNTNFRTITILPITGGLPVESFAMKLVHAFKQVGRTTIGLNQRTTLTHLGRHAFDKLSKLKESGYFAELEEAYQTVVYIADTPLKSTWTKTCIAQADCVILLADSADNPEIGEYESLLLKSKTTSRTELVLLHKERYVEPGLTQRWLRHRPWVHTHHHIQFNVDSMVTSVKESSGNIGALTLVDKFIQTEFGKMTQYNISRLLPDSIKVTVENFSSRFRRRERQYYTPVHRHKDDFLRLARILSGQAIGLVLGGGGARGMSHLGVLQALEERGIPIDMIGGTSIGSFVGGLYAKDYDLVPIYGRVKKFAGRISSLWRMLSDFTWPVTSYTTGHEFNRGIWKTFGDTRIEDFWVQYFCNSTNITESVQEIHSYGYAWRYIRASMSLAGLLPPIEDNGSMLLDGGYVDNLPVTEMSARGCNTIFAVDVGSVDDRTPMNYGDSLNGFWIVFNRWNPFSSHPNIPTMAEIQVRLGYVSSVNALEKAKRTPGVIYLRPPIENYATLDFGKFEEIYKVGADFGRVFLQTLSEEGNMPYIPGSVSSIAGSKDQEYLLQRRNSI
ncbi:Lysophospholipase NTE1 [Nakaseomyces bracarensis]|uniref:Lysophospholipase NTE1 n=1 Tax=Nakaseomyces bracarensis TaxID=273131 RepID=A0ABR4NXI1_9SACH